MMAVDINKYNINNHAIVKNIWNDAVYKFIVRQYLRVENNDARLDCKYNPSSCKFDVLKFKITNRAVIE